MKVYQHIIIIIALTLFTVFFYKEGLGAIAFLLAAFYLTSLFIREFKRSKKDKKA
ncbi:hypothetical protein [Sporosarcina sp. 6E9]|uniref:hypothetical protein n=1 Tax=Sporosarcina sp. 6E9 TaxID=2819235 RepID=UPI001B308C76|nr:hypothetical protein [Sporosarcina sp. 6E9]